MVLVYRKRMASYEQEVELLRASRAEYEKALAEEKIKVETLNKKMAAVNNKVSAIW